MQIGRIESETQFVPIATDAHEPESENIADDNHKPVNLEIHNDIRTGK